MNVAAMMMMMIMTNHFDDIDKTFCVTRFENISSYDPAKLMAIFSPLNCAFDHRVKF